MGELLQFKPRAELTPGPVSQSRTSADDDHDAACWMGVAMNWGWNIKEFTDRQTGLGGYMLFHDASGVDVVLFTLVRQGGTWRLWSRQRDLAEHETLYAALETVFPSRLAPEI